jgi:TetR/AcrR family transcriptional repressor of mexJK operon
MDEIAAAAHVSKQTIYTHFASKEELFADLVLANAERVDEFLAIIDQTLSDPVDLPAALRRLARQYLGFVVRPETLRLRRLIIGEAARFPKLARRYYELVPGRVYAALEAQFTEIGKNGQLRVDDPAAAARHFVGLTLGQPLDRGMFYPVESATEGTNLEELADSGVHVFLAAYSNRRALGRNGSGAIR